MIGLVKDNNDFNEIKEVIDNGGTLKSVKEVIE